MTCINPMPWSHAMTVDCQALSAQATAFITLAGTVITGSGPVSPLGGTTPFQYWTAPAAVSAAATSAGAASGPGCCTQSGVSGISGGGGGGSSASGGFWVGTGTTTGARDVVRVGSGVGVGASVV